MSLVEPLIQLLPVSGSSPSFTTIALEWIVLRVIRNLGRIDLTRRVKDGYFGLVLGIEVYGRNVVKDTYGFFDSSMKYLPNGLFTFEFDFRLCGMDVHVYAFRNNVEVNKVRNLFACRDKTLESILYSFVEVGMLHVPSIDEEILMSPFLLGRLWGPDKTVNLTNGRVHPHGQKILVEFLAKDVNDALAKVSFL